MPRPFGPEHETLRTAVRAFVAREIMPHVEAWERAGATPRSLLQRLGEQGFLSVKYPAALGGADDLPGDLVVQEELARCGAAGVAAVVGAHMSLATPPLWRWGTPAQQQRWLLPAIVGAQLGALAISEPDAGSDVATLRTAARREGDHYVVDGTKTFITNGVDADFIVVAVRTGGPGAGGISLLVVDGDTPGLSRRRIPTLGWRTSQTGELHFDGCRVPVANLLGAEHAGFAAIMAGFEWERLVLAATAVVQAELALDDALAYTRQRQAFGRPVASFQVIRHRLAELGAELTAARRLTYDALAAYAAGAPGAGTLCVQAKLLATELAVRATDVNLQMHGGHGYMMEYRAQRLWRDARLGTIGGGTSQIMREVVARDLGLPGPAAAVPPHPLFGPEHESLRALVRDVTLRELHPHVAEWEAAGGFAEWVFPRLGGLGLLGLRYPKEYGGQGLGYAAAVVLAEEMTAHHGAGGLPMAVMVQTEMATPPLLRFGTEAQKQKYLVPAIRGEKIACLGITEPDAGSDVAGITTQARREGDHWVINGRKIFITNGVRADYVVLVTKTDAGKGHRGFSLFVVDRDTPGFTVARKLEKVGMHESDTAELVFDECRVPAGALLGEEGMGFLQIMWELQGERLIASASAVAAARRTLETAVAYCQQRQAFGRAIGEFQALRHALADAAAALAAVRALVYDTCQRWDAGEYPVQDLTMCKFLAGKVQWQIVDLCLQVHGGAGYSMEGPVQRWWRDARLTRIGGGTDEIMLEVIAETMGLGAGRRA